MTSLATKHCVPCRGGTPPLGEDSVCSLLPEVPGWEVVQNHHLTRSWKFPDFAEALAFVVRVGAVAEAEGHHPDIELGWGRVKIKLWTHKIDGLTESDFILAAKINDCEA